MSEGIADHSDHARDIMYELDGAEISYILEQSEKQNGKCKAGSYYCYTDKVCKPIPKGFMVDPEGMLRKENGHTSETE